jgi:hypothetical protein
MFQQPHFPKPKYIHSYEYVIICHNFTSHMNIKGKKQQMMEKYKKQKIKYHSLTTSCASSKLFYFQK